MPLQFVVYIGIIIHKDGTIEFTTFRHAPGFIDEKDRVLKHYKSVFGAIPKTFIPPEAAGLESPFLRELKVYNPAMDPMLRIFYGK